MIFIIQTLIERAFKKRTLKKRKVPIPGWIMEVFDEHGIDTSEYVTNGRVLSDVDNPPSPCMKADTKLTEDGIAPPARSPCTEADTKPAEDGIAPLARSPCIKADAKLTEGCLNLLLAGHIPRLIEGKYGLQNYSNIRIRSPSQWQPLLRMPINLHHQIGLNFNAEDGYRYGGS